MTNRITITFFHSIVVGIGRADSKPRASFVGHDETARDFLFENVRGYRGPKHPFVRAPYARKIENLARANGFSVTVVTEPKPTPAQCKAAAEAFRRWVQTGRLHDTR